MQANWFEFGGLAWDTYLDASTIAEEWIRSSFSNDANFVKPIKEMILNSRKAVVNYMTRLGLHYIMDTEYHYGREPLVGNLSRPELNPVYYHKADKYWVEFNRTNTASSAIS